MPSSNFRSKTWSPHGAPIGSCHLEQSQLFENTNGGELSYNRHSSTTSPSSRQAHPMNAPRCFAFTVHAIFIAVCLAACERSRPIASTCDTNARTIDDSTIGPLHLAEELPALRVRCPDVRDTMVAVAGTTAPQPMMWLEVAGASVLIRHEGLTVTGLRVESPVFQTSDSLGVGTSIGKFRFVRGIRVAKAPDSPHAVLLDRRRCGVAYELSSFDTTAV